MLFSLFAFLCIGEITINSSDHRNLIMLPQLERLLNSHGQVTALQLAISKYKHSATRHPFVLYIHKEQSCCSVKTILDFTSARETVHGPLLCWPHAVPIKRHFFVEQLSRALRFCNLDPALYKTQFSNRRSHLGCCQRFYRHTDSPVRTMEI